MVATTLPNMSPPQRNTSASSTTMPYNTRRKSLSLTELGILPKRSRAPSHPTLPTTVHEEEPPAKKARRTSSQLTADSPNRPSQMSPPRTTAIRTKEPRPRPVVAQLSPPPSPVREGDYKIDVEGINDDIVVGVIEQLQRTGNRPHLVRELAAILALTIPAVDKSANPTALISSRLTSYLARARPTFTPCPVAKLIEPVHPRRLYFYLTTMPQRPLPTADEIFIAPPRAYNRITPSVSSHDEEFQEEQEVEIDIEHYQRPRQELSPSPEVDLSAPELDDHDDSAPASPRHSFNRMSTSQELPAPKNLLHNRRAASPQLEPEEYTFKQTANELMEQAALRHNSLKDVDMETQGATEGAAQDVENVVPSVEPQDAARQQREAVAELFAHADHLNPPTATIEFSSPIMLPQTEDGADSSQRKLSRHDEVMEHMHLDHDSKDIAIDNFTWDNLQSPEDIELAELDDMFDAY